jgi:predicted AAA+ superfamily ATPase
VNVNEINTLLLDGKLDTPGLFPHLEQLADQRFQFRVEFGLPHLPEEVGIISIRGARQYGKSTWLEQQLKMSVETYGSGSAFYLNGDEIKNSEDLAAQIRHLLPLYHRTSKVRRLFIDEITAIVDWQRTLKRLADAGELRKLLVVTTGSKADDFRQGIERLPGRKGKLVRDTFLFLPISYAEFKKVCGKTLGGNTLPAYLISGGSPVACQELANQQRLPEYVITMMRDWIYGEISAAKRERSSLLAVFECLFRFATTPVGQAKLARESGLANNTVAAGYIEQLTNLLCIAPCYVWDQERQRPIRRQPHKLHFINLLAATAWHPANLRSLEDFKKLSLINRGAFYEWRVAQELWRRSALRFEEAPEMLKFWKTKEHELDYIADVNNFIEVKHGQASPLEFSWFTKQFKNKRLTVINQNRFETDQIIGLTLEDWLLNLQPS